MDHYATLYELQTVYSYLDLLHMVECIQVDRFNQYVAHKNAMAASERTSAPRTFNR